MKINKNLVLEFMMKNELSINSFSQISRLHRNTIVSILNNKPIQLKSALKLAKFLNINLIDLFN